MHTQNKGGRVTGTSTCDKGGSGEVQHNNVLPGAGPHCVDALFDAYGKPTEQVGYTDGHYCLTKPDREEASRCASSLLYGEILASGVTKLLDGDHLDASNAQVLYDLGMGVGKLCLQAFLQFPSLRLVLGVELAYSRYRLAEEALARLVSIHPSLLEIEAREPGEFIRVHTIASPKPRNGSVGHGMNIGGGDNNTGSSNSSSNSRRSRRRVIELRRGNMWSVRGINAVDVVILHTELTVAALGKVRRLVGEMKRGARFVTYQDLSKQRWYGQTMGGEPPFQQLPANVPEGDQFATSWSAVKGHHLFCWVKTAPRTVFGVNGDDGARCSGELEESKEGITSPTAD